MSKLPKILNRINEISIERQNEQIKLLDDKKTKLISQCNQIIDNIYLIDLKSKSNTILDLLRNILSEINKYTVDIQHVNINYLIKYEEYISIMDIIVNTLLKLNNTIDDKIIIITECVRMIKSENPTINVDIIFDILNTICDLHNQDIKKLKFTLYNN
jgi:hypothetical protein